MIINIDKSNIFYKFYSETPYYTYMSALIYFAMERGSKNRSDLVWIEEIWEEIEVQFYGIIGAILFFTVIYFMFHPSWMANVFDFFVK